MNVTIKNFVITEQNRNNFYAKVSQLDPTRHWVANIIERKSKRSLDQNERYWKLITEFGDHCGYDKDEMHQLIGRRFLTYEKTVDGKVMKFVKSTSKLNTKEMTDLQDNIERVAADIGFIFGGLDD